MSEATTGQTFVRTLLDEWAENRRALRAIEESEHPSFLDGYGREWVWRDKDLYCHDDALTFPRAMIDALGLPSARLARNQNYARLCAICKRDWSL